MTEPDRKTVNTAAAKLALHGYSLTEIPTGWRIEGQGRTFCTPMWPKVALFARLNTSGEAGKHDANHGT